jgi:hypothetical protein
MSSTNRSAPADGMGRYYTPDNYARAIVSKLALPAQLAVAVLVALVVLR